MSQTIADGLQRIIDAKTDLDNAIEAKGGTVTKGLENSDDDIMTITNQYTQADEGKVVSEGDLIAQTAMPDEITENSTIDTTFYNSVTVNVPSGGGGSDVIFYDYDGSVVASYSAADFANLSELPANPTHAGLTAQGWNWSLSDAKTHVAANGKLDIGQMYITSDGKTRIYINLSEGRTSPVLMLYLNANTELDIDWGDGSTHSTFTSTTADYKSERHNYPDKGEYVIAITVVSGSFILQSQQTTYNTFFTDGKNSSDSSNSVYLNSIQKIEIGTGVTTIGNYAFYNCYSLTSITIPNSVTTIGTYVFYYCYSLSSVTIPNGVTAIGQYVFYYCYSLSSVTIPNGVTAIGQYAFRNCYSLSSITIPNSVTTIGNYAFYYCPSLSSITISNGVTTIQGSAFYGCYALTSITIPNGVTAIGSGAFSNCTLLSSITIPSSVNTIQSDIFYGCVSLHSITIPNGVITIGSGAFGNCLSLSSVTIPNGVTSIGNSAFYYCPALSTITIPDSVNSIGSSAFGGCYSLSSVTIPNSVTTIGNNTFQNCFSLSSITIPNSVTTIEASAFYGCKYMDYIRFMRTTPPTVQSSNAWQGVSTSTLMLVPATSYKSYITGTNYPSSLTYTYLIYDDTYVSGATLPATVESSSTTYNLTWYASREDAVAQTNPITTGTGNEVYARAVEVV